MCATCCRKPLNTGSSYAVLRTFRDAQLDADRTVHITSPDGPEREVAARAVLVATGSRPTRYPGIPFDDPDVYDSDEIYSLRTVPNDIVIVGGGPIGVEFATVFTALGIPRHSSAIPIACCRTLTAN